MEAHKEHLVSITEGTVCTPLNIKGKEMEESGSPYNVFKR